MQAVIYTMLILPIVFALIAITNRLSKDVLHLLNRIVAIIVTGCFIRMTSLLAPNAVFTEGLFYLDALNMWVLCIVITLYFASALLSKNYLIREETRGYLDRGKTYIGKYYALFTMFIWTMMLALVVENLGLMWVCIEATTLVSALLVSFKFTRSALEATWKYIMVCTVGICLALLGTIILYYAQMHFLGTENPLSWVYLKNNARSLDPNLIKLSFLFVLIGYGTKIGLAPMHTWLPDAYSEAPSLISGLLSGALCSCAIYVFIRNFIIMVPTLGTAFTLNTLYAFAFFTIAIVMPFSLVQRDIKRLLAYSSMENIGIMIIGLGLFTYASVSATLLHIFNHALIKFTLFFIAGTIIQEYRTKNMMRIHGMIKETPTTATLLLMGMLAILGNPPFGIFFTKLTILLEMFKNGQYFWGSILIILLAGVLMGILYHFLRMLSGKAKKPAQGELLTTGEVVLFSLMLIVTIVLSAFLENIPYLQVLLANAAHIVVGGISL